MSMVEVRHRASEALQKPSMHETAKHESRLWIFDPVSSRATERKQETKRSEPLWGRRQIGCFASCVVCSLVILLHRSRSTDQPGQSMVVAMTAVKGRIDTLTALLRRFAAQTRVAFTSRTAVPRGSQNETLWNVG